MFITAVCFLFLIKLHWCSKIIWRFLVLNSFKDDNDLRTSVSLFHMFAEVYRKEWRSSWCYQQLRFVLLWSLFFKTWEHQPLVFFMDLEFAVLRTWIEQAPDWVTGKTPAIPSVNGQVFCLCPRLQLDGVCPSSLVPLWSIVMAFGVFLVLKILRLNCFKHQTMAFLSFEELPVTVFTNRMEKL